MFVASAQCGLMCVCEKWGVGGGERSGGGDGGGGVQLSGHQDAD